MRPVVRPRFSKQLLELTTMSVSVHRAKAQARAAGYINPKGIARGGRTIAGTMVMTKFAAEVLLRFLASGLTSDKSRSLRPMKPKAPRARARAGRRHSTWVAPDCTGEARVAFPRATRDLHGG